MTRRASIVVALVVAMAGALWWVRSRDRQATPPEIPAGTAAPARALLLVTIDTLRADHVGIYGYAAARTPSLDGVARTGVRFSRAYAPAPITLPSHASALTGLDPPAHGARHNGVRLKETVPTLATLMGARGFASAAFVSAFPLDRRFGLSRGFSVYDDQMPRDGTGRLLNERTGAATVERAIPWVRDHLNAPFFLWVHLFEPHAPYGDHSLESRRRPVIERYDDEIAEADRQVGRLLDALGPARGTTLVVIASDHGEAFGEHGEISHSLFVYDTTLRVPWVMSGPGVPSDGRTIDLPVSLTDLAPTVLSLLGEGGLDADGIDLSPVLGGGAGAQRVNRVLYAESMAPLFDFGWSPLRAVREGPWKYIDAPHAELYDLSRDPEETDNLAVRQPDEARRFAQRVERFGPATPVPAASSPVDREAASRLAALGYVTPDHVGTTRTRPDPKDRRQVAARLAEIASGELPEAELIPALEAVLREDPPNPQAHLRLGVALADRGACGAAEPYLRRAIAAGVPSADPFLAMALCLRAREDQRGAEQMLMEARRVEPGNPTVDANLGLLALDEGRLDEAVQSLEAALAVDADLHQARFALARALARRGQREAARRQAETLLQRLPASAPQRPEVERLLAALR